MGEARPAWSGMETCGQARLSPSWMQISLAVATAAIEYLILGQVQSEPAFLASPTFPASML